MTLAVVFDVGEADDVRRRFALGVLALVFLALVDALDVERGDLLDDGLVDLALDPDEALVLVGQLLVERGRRHVEQLGHLAQLGDHLGVLPVDVFGDRPDAGRDDARGQQQAVAVEDAAAVGGQLQGAGETHLALALEEVVADHLHVHRARGQAHEAERDRGHDELAAPHRRLAGEQRAGGVLDAAAAAHRVAFLAAAAAAAAAGVPAGGVAVRVGGSAG